MKSIPYLLVFLLFSIYCKAQNNKFTPAYEVYYLNDPAEADSLNWQKEYSKSYIYDSKGNVLESLIKNKAENYNTKETFKYDNENRVIEHLQENIDKTTANKQLIYKYTYVYSNSGKLIQQTLINPGEDKNRRITNTYNSNDSLILLKVEDYMQGSWQHTGGAKYDYVKISDTSFMMTEYFWRNEMKVYERQNKKIFYYSGADIVAVDHYKVNYYTNDWGLYIRANYRNFKNGQFTEYEYVEFAAKQKVTDSAKIINGLRMLEIAYDPLKYYTPVTADFYYYDAQTNTWKPLRKMYREYHSNHNFTDWNGNYDTLGQIRYTSKVTTELDSLNRLIAYHREYFIQGEWRLNENYTIEYIYSGGELSKVLWRQFSRTEMKMVDFSLKVYGEKYVVSVEEENNPENQFLNIYPNPANDFISVNISTNQINNVKMCDISGRLVKTVSIRNNQNTTIRIDISDIPNGFYFMHFEGDELLKTEKLLISR